MNDNFFLDTNIFVHSFNSMDSDKKSTAQNLIKNALATNQGFVSYQVIQEFVNVATRKFKTPLSHSDLHKYLDQVFLPLCKIFPSLPFYINALELMKTWRYSWYDTLVITAAIDSRCSILYSEDLQHGQRIKDLLILNPFA